jgi:hypothetical protein
MPILRPLAEAIALVTATVVAQAADLRDPQSFGTIADTRARSLALFEEAGKVLQHPRCVNCHPPDDRPRQGMTSKLHQPAAVRGIGDHGVAAMTCDACHHEENYDVARVPGNPAWRLAPAEMPWLGKSLGEICTQIKDRERNGGRSLDEIADHASNDSLVGWGWAPGAGREPAPGTQKQFGALIRAWIDSGAVCPAG